MKTAKFVLFNLSWLVFVGTCLVIISEWPPLSLRFITS